jgi:diketogulonate reductase-like aldo/keto reductase
MRTICLPSGDEIPVLGQGTWRMGEDPAGRAGEVRALRLGLDLGLTLIDTAEIYADGGAELVVGEAIAGRRDEVFLVSKVHPLHASFDGTIAACEASLRRMGTDHLDLYLLHWREHLPLDETLRGFQNLQQAGKIAQWGVSCFGVSDIEEMDTLPGGLAVAADQVLYNLTKRGIELDLLPLCQKRSIPVMAYSPVGEGDLTAGEVLDAIGAERGATPAQVALAWVLRQDNVVAIPKASSLEHVRANRAAADLSLTAPELDALNEAFPSPAGRVPLEIFQHTPA